MDSNLANESGFKTEFERRLLVFLLQKYERSQAFISRQPALQRPQFAMKGSPFHTDYHDEMDYRKKEWMNEILLELQQEGIIDLSWDKFNKTLVTKVYLQLEALDRAYVLAGLQPKHEKLERLQKILEPLSDHPWTWVRTWQQETAEQLSRRTYASVELDDPEGYTDLVKCLQALPGIDISVPKRMFSQSLFGDSKYFEQRVEKRLVSLLKHYSGMEFESNEEYLDSIGIVFNPPPILVCGSLRCQVREEVLNTAGFIGGIGLSLQTVKELEILELGAERIVTIENLTSYHQWIHQRSHCNEVVIYTGGFPHRGMQIFLGRVAHYLKQHLPDLQVVHWGDIDLGGIRIFEFLKLNYFPSLQPVLMDLSTLLNHHQQAMAVSGAYLSKVKMMLEDESNSFWHEVLEVMYRQGIRMEQESIQDVAELSICTG